MSTTPFKPERVTWNQFIEALRKDEDRPHCKWRGVKSSRHELSSSFQWKVVKRLTDQNRNAKEITKLRDKLHRYFSLAIRGLRGDHPNTLDYNQVWAMGRHFGLNTPLLDWTNSPFLAAYFAVFCLVDDYVENGTTVPDEAWFGAGSPVPAGAKLLPPKDHFAVYQIKLTADRFPWVEDAHRSNDAKREIPFIHDTAASIRMFQPESGKLPDGEYLLFLGINVEEVRRMQGQRGYFTVLNSAKHLKIESFLEEYGATDVLKKYEIPVTDLREAFEHLLIHGIDNQLMYPDLEGAAKQANLLCDVDIFHDADARKRSAP